MRYKRVIISGEFFTMLATENNEIHAKCVNGLPKGTRFRYVIPEPYYGVAMVVEHESFPELKDGDEIPTFEPKPEFHKL